MATTIDRSPDYKVVGTRPVRHDGVDKVTGRAKFGADVHGVDLLHGKILRSPHAHARIKSIDASKALKLPGVRAVVTSQDLPEPPNEPVSVGEGPMVNLRYISSNVLAREKALYKGHAIAAVAADSLHVAEEALDLIEVEYEVLPPVMTAFEAMQDGAPILHDSMTTMSLGKDTGKNSNVAVHTQFTIGDVEKGFKEADVVIEREFNTKTVHQGYIEPQNATVHWASDGKITIWTSNQGHFGVRQNTAALLGVPVSQVHVIPMEIGGGFGGKINIYMEPVAAVMSRMTGHPVKMVMTRTEVLESTGPGSGTYTKAKLGFSDDGRIVAAQGFLAFDAGAFPGSPVTAGAMCMLGMYNIENAHLDAYDVVVNKPKTSAYRAPGSPQATLAVESIVDEFCLQKGIDPLEFRMKNASKEGDRQVTGAPFGNIGNVEVLEAAKSSDHWNTPLEGKHRGRGISSGFWFNGGMQSSCNLQVNPDGTVAMIEGSVDIGGTRAAIAMQAAEVLGLAAEEVHPVVGDTASIGYTRGHGRQPRRLRHRLGRLRSRPGRGSADEGAGRPDLGDDRGRRGLCRRHFHPHIRRRAARLASRTCAKRLMETGGTLVGKGTVSPRGVGAAFGHHIVDVEVDTETGKVDVLRYTAIQDAGKAIHPSYVEGQIQGGVVQGIGWALNEEYYYNDEGVMANSSLLDYRMPTSLDLPMIDTILVEVPNPGHPYGARGVGEVPIVPPLAAHGQRSVPRHWRQDA